MICIPRKITNILEVMKLAAHVEDFAPEADRIHLSNGTLMPDGSFAGGADRALCGADCRWHIVLTHRLPFSGFLF